jgi:hypothetical protein
MRWWPSQPLLPPPLPAAASLAGGGSPRSCGPGLLLPHGLLLRELPEPVHLLLLLLLLLLM